MASKRRIGRPGNNWTRERKRKLLRLYSFTTLHIEDIRRVLRESRFNPCLRDYKKQLKGLSPVDYSLEWRRYRPSNYCNARRRFDQLKSCKDGQTSKIKTLVASTRPREARHHSGLHTSTDGHARPLNPWCNPLSNYIDPPSGNERFICPEALLKTKAGNAQSLDGPNLVSLYDSDTVIRGTIHKGVNIVKDHENSESMCDGVRETSSSHFTQILTYPDQFETVASGFLASTEVSKVPSILFPDTKDSTVTTTAQPLPPLRKTLSIRSLQRRLTGKAGNDTIDHIHSVLRFSSSNSWRSSIASFARSWKSRGSSLLHRKSAMDDNEASAVPTLSINEQMSWDELVDETKLAPPTPTRPNYQELSLSQRRCCGSVGDFNDGFSCSTCGFSSAHYNGRNCVDIINQGFGTCIFSCSMSSIDLFGNTPLHFAAASACITTTALKKLITSGVNIKARNTSGENFLHVLNVAGLGDISEYINLLEFLDNTDFQFSDRDIHGRTIAHRLFEVLKPSELNMHHLEEIFQLLRVNISAVDNLGNDYGLSELIHGWHVDVKNTSDRSKLRLRLHQNPERLKVDYQEMLLSVPKRRGASLRGNINLLGMEDWLSTIKSRSLFKWVDINGDTPLTALVRYCPESGGEEMFRAMIQYLVSDGCDVNARDRKGYTALAIATSRGLRPIVSCLIDLGAMVNTRSYHGTSTISHTAESLHRAAKNGNERLYGMIISCITLITDKGAKSKPSVYDEFGTV